MKRRVLILTVVRAALILLAVGAALWIPSCGYGSLTNRLDPPAPKSPSTVERAGRIAFVVDLDPSSLGKHALFVSDPDGSNRKRLTDEGVGGPIAWSPDGKMLAYSHSTFENPGIYVVQIESGAITRLTSVKDDWDGHPVWSPDGTKIAYLYRGDVLFGYGTREDLRVADLQKGSWKTVDRGSGFGSFSWSPDSRYLYFSAEDTSTREEFKFGWCITTWCKWFFYRVDLKTGKQKKLWPHNGSNIACSPKGSRLAVIMERDGKKQLFISDLEGKTLRPIAITGFSLAGDVSWSPQGDRLIVSALPADCEYRSAGYCELLLVNLDDGKVSHLTNNKTSEWYISWSPDGTRIVFEKASAKALEVVILDLRTGEETFLADGTNPCWSP